MSTTLTIRDQTTAGQNVNELTLEVLTERISVRELIRSRVYQEVKDHNTSRPGYFLGLVKPTEAEETLNGYKLRRARQIDWRPQYERAIEAFESNGIIILVDDRQVDSLDEEIEVRPDTSVTFLKLVPLVGG